MMSRWYTMLVQIKYMCKNGNGKCWNVGIVILEMLENVIFACGGFLPPPPPPKGPGQEPPPVKGMPKLAGLPHIDVMSNNQACVCYVMSLHALYLHPWEA